MFKDKIFVALFAFIVLVGAFLRLYRLSEVPFGFHIDEASLGYNAYSLLLTGKDDSGNSFPLYIDMFGDQRPTGYHYLAIPSVKVFGLSEFSTRLPGAVFGTGLIFAVFFLALALFKNKYIALLSSTFIAISPWSIVLSRASAEAVVALFFIMLGFGLTLFSIQKRKTIFLTAGCLSLIISFFFYHTPRVFVPLLFFFFIIFSFKLFKKEMLKALLISFLAVSLSAILLVFSVPGGTGRFNQVNIFSHPETFAVLTEQTKEDAFENVGALTARIFHNKFINYSRTFFLNYFEYFKPNFLFTKGGLPIWYQVPGMGLLYIVELPLILLGLFYLLKKNSLETRFIFLWIILSPVVSSITFDDVPNINRAIVLFPALEIVSAFGVYNFLKNKPYLKEGAFLLILIFTYNLSYFLHQYFVHSEIHRNWYRNVGVKEAIEKVKENYSSYDKVIITKSTGGIYPLVLFYLKYDPAFYQKEGSTKDKEYTGFGKLFFAPEACPSSEKDSKFPKVKKTIYIDKGSCPYIPGQNSEMILRPDGTPVYKVVYVNL